MNNIYIYIYIIINNHKIVYLRNIDSNIDCAGDSSSCSDLTSLILNISRYSHDFESKI